jgi:hypothetical protein
MKLIKTLATFAVPALVAASCQKELAPIPQTPPPKDTAIAVTTPQDTIPAKQYPAPDTATLMIRDGIWYAQNDGSDYNNFFLEPLQVETSVPQSGWLRATFDANGDHILTVSTPAATQPQMAIFDYGYYQNRYWNPSHTNALGYGNATLSTDIYVSRADSGIVAYGINAGDTIERATTVRLIMAEKTDINAYPVNGANPMAGANAHSITTKAFIRPNSALGRNGPVYKFR